MNQPIKASPVCGINECQTANNGDLIVFGLRIGDRNDNTDANFAIPYDLLSPLVTNLLTVGDEAEKMRAENPIHQSKYQSGFVLDMQKLSIGPHGKKKGWHVLQFSAQGTGGSTSYRIAADRTRLENLLESLLAYLDNMDQDDPGQPIQH